jgi:hypothetical protein
MDVGGGNGDPVASGHARTNRVSGVHIPAPTDATTRVADFYKGSNLLIGAKKRITGSRIQAG